MPAILPNTPTTNSYPTSGGASLGLGDVFASGYFVVANAAVFCQYQHGPLGQADYSNDLYLPPATYPLYGTDKDPLGGIRFKSAVTNTPAQVFGVLYKKDESSLLAGSEFNAVVSSSGTVSSGGSLETGDIVWSAATARSGSVKADGSFYDGTNPIYTALWVALGSVAPQNNFAVPDLRGRMPVAVGTHVDVNALFLNEGAVLASRRPKHRHTVNLTGNPLTDGGGALENPGGGFGVQTLTVGPQVASPTDAPAYLVLNAFIIL